MAIVVIDYHKGNLSSVVRGLVRAGAEAYASDDPEAIASAEGLVLPGVGAFADAMDYMDGSGQSDAVRDAVAGGAPFLGICLGVQLLFDRGDEGVPGGVGDCSGATRPGLGILPGSVARLRSERLKVPHVGWDTLDLAPAAGECPLLADVPWGANTYFTHSYVLAGDVDPAIVMAKTHYAVTFPSAIWGGPRRNVYGTQFHPEKSSWVGHRILRNFTAIVERASEGASA